MRQQSNRLTRPAFPVRGPGAVMVAFLLLFLCLTAAPPPAAYANGPTTVYLPFQSTSVPKQCLALSYVNQPGIFDTAVALGFNCWHTWTTYNYNQPGQYKFFHGLEVRHGAIYFPDWRSYLQQTLPSSFSGWLFVGNECDLPYPQCDLTPAELAQVYEWIRAAFPNAKLVAPHPACPSAESVAKMPARYRHMPHCLDYTLAFLQLIDTPPDATGVHCYTATPTCPELARTFHEATGLPIFVSEWTVRQSWGNAAETTAAWLAALDATPYVLAHFYYAIVPDPWTDGLLTVDGGYTAQAQAFLAR
ncbi:MAG: hypothetical protein KC418_19790 [Anaerolineales bacterium]|nr:hypothetical protein [Anaerolineales bacterium]MCB8950770.1 hypothetical protein [Ardenticatenales bacterium]